MTISSGDYQQALKKAYQENRLLLFCGAGISRYANFPSFWELARDIKDAAIKRTEEKWASDTEWQQYRNDIETEFADNKLVETISWSVNLLDKFESIGEQHIRSLIIESFNTKYQEIAEKKTSLHIHSKLLSLAKNGSSSRLVTTNWDDLFSIADASPAICERFSYGINQPPDPPWNGRHYVYHCHGVIDKENAQHNNTHIVLTRKDYDQKYASNSSAANLLELLLQEYVVLFVGYSLEEEIRHLLQLVKNQMARLARSLGPSEAKIINAHKKFYVAFPFHDSKKDWVEQWEKLSKDIRQQSLPVTAIKIPVPLGKDNVTPDANLGLEIFLDQIQKNISAKDISFMVSEQDLPSLPPENRL